jgi:beta-lactamase regulating signal transducer with metallopeptidase domain
MMFFALAITLCMAVLFIVIATASVLSVAVLRLMRRWLSSLSPKARADWLFSLRILPLVLAGAITIGLALPAFLKFEPRTSHENLAPRLMVLAALGALVVTLVVIRTVRILKATHQAQRQWRSHAHPLLLESTGVPVYCSGSGSPLLAVAGFIRPQIFVTESVMRSLSPRELSAAIGHELAHVSALDNIKQLILKVTRAPKWLRVHGGMDTMWLNAAEVAADEHALAGGASALDLSSALVKVAGLSRRIHVGDTVATSQFLPDTMDSCVQTRVTYLRHRLEREEQGPAADANKSNSYWPVIALTVAIVGYAVCLNAILPWMHELLEMLVG